MTPDTRETVRSGDFPIPIVPRLGCDRRPAELT